MRSLTLNRPHDGRGKSWWTAEPNTVRTLDCKRLPRALRNQPALDCAKVASMFAIASPVGVDVSTAQSRATSAQSSRCAARRWIF